LNVLFTNPQTRHFRAQLFVFGDIPLLESAAGLVKPMVLFSFVDLLELTFDVIPKYSFSPPTEVFPFTLSAYVGNESMRCQHFEVEGSA